jgi:hypothetical protein
MAYRKLTSVKTGMRVKYHPVIDEADDGGVYVVRDVGFVAGDRAVAWLEGRQGCVSVLALSDAPPEAKEE